MKGSEFGRGPLSPADNSALFKGLCDSILERAQGALKVNRQVRADAQAEFAAVSWTGDAAYKLARACQRDIAAAAMKKRKGQTLNGYETGRIRDRCRARYKHTRKADYAHELYIFFKTSELAPQTLSTLAPGLMSNLAAVPLHHFYIVSREQRAADAGEPVLFTPWQLEPGSFRSSAALIDALHERIFPEPVADKKRRRWPWPEIIAAVVFISLMALAAFSAWHWREPLGRYLESLEAPAPAALSAMSGAPSGAASGAPPAPGDAPRLAALEAGLETVSADLGALSSRVSRLEAELADLAARGASAAQLTAAADALVAAGGASSAAPTGGLDLAPCLPVREAGGRRIPAFLFVAVIGEAGVTAVARTPGPDEPDLSPYTSLLPFMGRTVDADAFRAGAAELFARSQADNCRHYVLLSGAAEGDAARYAALRQAVEDHFYIHRLRR